MTEPLGYRARKWFLQKVTPLIHKPTQHERISAVNWDVLLVLDACRLDTLRDVGSWAVHEEISPASNTGGWLRATVESDILSEATLVTANPQYEHKNRLDINLRKFIDISESARNPALETVLPDAVLERVDKEIQKNQPVAGHLIQPHAPYVHRIGNTWIDGLGSDWRDREYDGTQEALTRGSIDQKRAEQAYRASVKSTVETIEPWIEQWVNDGYHVAVTADHGEVFGGIRDLGIVEHPHGCFIPGLVRVPFVEFVPPKSNEIPRDKLKALGYVS